MTLNLVMSSKTQQKSQYTKCFKYIKTLTFKNVYIHSVKGLTQENERTKC